MQILQRGLARSQALGAEQSKVLSAADESVVQAGLGQMAQAAEGDARRALNLLESMLKSDPQILRDAQALEKFLKEVGSSLRSMSDDLHYSLASIYIKAMRANDEKSAIEAALKLLSHGEDPLFLARRLVIFAAEDVGLASPQLLPFVDSILSADKKIGMPEAKYLIIAGTMAASRSKKSREVADKISAAENGFSAELSETKR